MQHLYIEYISGYNPCRLISDSDSGVLVFVRIQRTRHRETHV